MADLQCPKCSNIVGKLYPIEAGLRLALRATGQELNIPDQVCENCYSLFSGQMSQGVRLRLEREAKDKNRALLWKSRVNLIKQARQLMAQKAFSEAAISYEKYLRILELVYDTKKGELTPTVFSNDPRSKELTVVTSVYWDLFRIYDNSTRSSDRMHKVAMKLAEFARFSPLFPEIIKKAEQMQKSAKNQGAIRTFLKSAHDSRPRCFIATEAFFPEAPEVRALQAFRDQTLKVSPWGRRLVHFYYKRSPTIALWLSRRSQFKPMVRALLRLIIVFTNFQLKRRRGF